MIKAVIHGIATKDGNWIQTKSGTEMAGTVIAVNDADNKGEAVFVNIVGFNKMASEIVRLKKGDKGITVTGDMKLNYYTSKRDNAEHMQWQIVAESIVSSRGVRGGKTKDNPYKQEIPGRADFREFDS